MRKLCVPSALSYQPSNAGVMLAPNSLGGFCGMGVKVWAPTSTLPAASATMISKPDAVCDFIADAPCTT